jgi:hypothetical protein
MALLSLIFKRPKKLQINAPTRDGLKERVLLILDAADQISHQNRATPTENPIEDGSMVADHVDRAPKSVTFQGVVSEAPIQIEQAVVGNVAGAVGGIIGKAAGTLAGVGSSLGVAALGGLLLNRQGNRVQDAFNALLEIQDKAIPVTLITGLRAYNNMILTEFTPIETADTGRSLSFTATFSEIKIVSSKQIRLPKKVLAAAVAPSAASVINQGTKVATEAPASLLSTFTGVGS